MYCGLLFKHKRMDSKAYKREVFLHKATGECGTRQRADEKEREERSEAGKNKTSDMMVMWTEVAAPMIARLGRIEAEIDDLKDRVSRRLESRKKKREFTERDSKPGPWDMRSVIKQLKEHSLADRIPVGPAEKFREVMTKPLEGGWNWERAMSTWYHWLLDQSSADPIMVMCRDDIRFWHNGKCDKRTKLQFFRCFGKCPKWDPCEEEFCAFFVGFYYPLVAACRKLNHWDNRILFDMPCTEQRKHTFSTQIFPKDPYFGREPDFGKDKRIATVFWDVLVERRATRLANAHSE